MEEEFIKWFEENEIRFAHGQFDEKEIAYSAWLQGRKSTFNNKQNALYWWENLDYNTKKYWFDIYCNRFTRNVEQISDSEIEEIWIYNIKNK